MKNKKELIEDLEILKMKMKEEILNLKEYYQDLIDKKLVEIEQWNK
jgi:hypothetical protein